ncbi:hypothetical protein RYX36_013074 [Vicia faba]
MEEDEYCSEFSMAFPPYRPSHFHSKTYTSLVHILSTSLLPPFQLTPSIFLVRVNQKLICVTDATNSSSEEGDLEEGEISGDFAMDGNTFDAGKSKRGLGSQEKKIRKLKRGYYSNIIAIISSFMLRIRYSSVVASFYYLNFDKTCVHFARHSCMKGDDCPFDHQLSKYPCSNIVSNGSCSRGHACLFSHQVRV